MKNFINSLEGKKIHFVGVGGISVSGLALYALDKKAVVSGSDSVRSEATDRLKNLGVEVNIGHKRSNLKNDVQLVVYTSAVREDNPELKKAIELNIPTVKRSQFLGSILEAYRDSVAISGCHGKTTATAMLSQILLEDEKTPTIFLGGEYGEYKNYRLGSGSYVVAEACEYKKNFLDLKARISVVLNIDNDHLDSYKDLSDTIGTFKSFVSESLAVVNADDINCKNVFHSSTVTFGIENLATYMAKSIKFNGKGYTFTACAYGRRYGKINLSIIGRHNIYNALAAFAVADVLGVSFGAVKRALEKFSGVKRRNEYLGELFGLPCYADYAHHPNELRATLSAFKETMGEALVVFQPHTYSRTRLLMADFVSVLKEFEDVIIYETYAARENYDQSGSATALCENVIGAGGKGVEYAETEDELLKKLKTALKGKSAIIFLGAGDIYDIAKSVLGKYLQVS